MNIVWMQRSDLPTDATRGQVVREPEGTRWMVSDGEGWWSFLPLKPAHDALEAWRSRSGSSCQGMGPSDRYPVIGETWELLTGELGVSPADANDLIYA